MVTCPAPLSEKKKAQLCWGRKSWELCKEILRCEDRDGLPTINLHWQCKDSLQNYTKVGNGWFYYEPTMFEGFLGQTPLMVLLVRIWENRMDLEKQELVFWMFRIHLSEKCSHSRNTYLVYFIYPKKEAGAHGEAKCHMVTVRDMQW